MIRLLSLLFAATLLFSQEAKRYELTQDQKIALAQQALRAAGSRVVIAEEIDRRAQVIAAAQAQANTERIIYQQLQVKTLKEIGAPPDCTFTEEQEVVCPPRKGGTQLSEEQRALIKERSAAVDKAAAALQQREEAKRAAKEAESK